MQIQRCNSIGCNPRNNSVQSVNFKAVQEINRNNIYLKGVKEPIIDKAISNLLLIFGERDVVLYSEGSKFGVKFPEDTQMHTSRPFDIYSPQAFADQVFDLGIKLADKLQVFA